jgi:hypothetical protein
MPAAARNDIYGHASVKQGRLVGAAQVVEAQFGEIFSRLSFKGPRNRMGVSKPCKVDVTAEAWKHQRALGQLNQR